MTALLVVMIYGKLNSDGKHRTDRLIAEVFRLGGDPIYRAELIETVALAGGLTACHEPDDSSAGGPDTIPIELAPSDGNGSGRMILVAEDNEINRRVIRKQLARLGVTADIVADGREAIARIRGGEYVNRPGF